MPIARNPSPRLRVAALLAMLALASPWAARAQQISPVLVELSGTRRVVSVTVVNRSSQPMAMQSQVLAWEQAEGADRYQPTSDLMVVPPLATVPPGGSQIFRVALRRAPSTQELSYRLILQDVSAETQPSSNEGGGASVRLQFRHSLPVFVAAPAKAAGKAQLVPCPGKTAPDCVRVENAGDLHVKVSRLVAEGGAWRKELPSATVLPAAWRQWTFDDAPAGPIAVTAHTSAGTLSLQLPSRTP